MIHKWYVPLIVLLAIAVASTGCVKRVPLAASQSVNLSLNQTLAAIATTNKAMATDVIALSTAGVLKGPVVNSVLNYNRSVAQTVITAENLQAGLLSDADKVAAIKKALSELSLPADVSALLTGPQADQAVTGLVTTIKSLQGLIAAISGGK
jgi:hypothetical protein